MEKEVAVFIDYENIVYSARQYLNKNNIKWDKIAKHLQGYGRVAVKMAFADWVGISEDEQQTIRRAGFIVMPSAGKKENSADLYMSIEMMDTLTTKNFDLYVVASGDGDFLPVVQKLRQHGKYVIGLGIEGSAASLLKSTCDEYIYYGDILGLKKQKQPARASRSRHQVAEADLKASLQDQLKKALQDSGEWENGSRLGNKLRQQNSGLDRDMEKAGLASLRELLEDNADIVEIRFISPTQMEVRSKISKGTPEKTKHPQKLIVKPPQTITVDYYIEILSRKNLRDVVPIRLRPGIIYQAYNLVESGTVKTFNELRQKILEPAENLAVKRNIQLDHKAVNNVMVQLFRAGCFEFQQSADEELWDRQFSLRSDKISSQQELLSRCDKYLLRQVDSALPDELDLDPDIAIQLLYGDDNREIVMNHTIALINAIQTE